MKKTIIWSLVIMMATAFVFTLPLLAEYNPGDEDRVIPEGTFVTTSVEVEEETEELEKISSPAEIPNFTNIIKRGTDLFGLRRAHEAMQNNNSQNPNREEVQNRILEKIAAPQFVDLYENIKRMGNALWGNRKMENSNANENQNITDRLEELRQEMHIQSPSDMSLFKNIRKMDGRLFGILKDVKDVPEKYAPERRMFTPILESEKDCVIETISEKDISIEANNLKFAEDLNTAITTRRTCQTTAIELSEGQREAFETCNKEFKTAQEEIRKNSRTAQESFWKTYKEDLLACRPQVGTSTPIVIEDGGANIY